jgi:hypothetical protein
MRHIVQTIDVLAQFVHLSVDAMSILVCTMAIQLDAVSRTNGG